MSYKVLKVIDSAQVPDWERRPAKWSDLVDAVMSIPKGDTLPVRFDDYKIARRAANAVRDTANLKARAVVVRTRVVAQEDGSAILYLTRTKVEA